MDVSHGQIEGFAAKMLAGSTLPSVGSAEYARTFFLNTSNNKIYYYTAEDNTGSWTVIETDVILVTLADNKGDILVATGPDAWDILPIGEVNQVLTVLDNDGNVGWTTLLTTKGDLLTLDGTDLTRLPVGLNAYILTADSSTLTGLRWSLVNTASIQDAAITTSKFMSSSVIESKIDVGAVISSDVAELNATTIKFADASVTENKFLTSSVITSKIANEGITEVKIGDGAVTVTRFAPSSVTAQKILNSAVINSKINNAAVTTAKLAASSVSTVKINDNSVLSIGIADNAVVTSKILDDAVTTSRVADNSIFGASIADLNVTTPKIQDLTVSTLQLAPAGVVTGKINDLAVVTSKIPDLSVIGSKIISSAVVESKIAGSNITTSKVADNSVDAVAFRQSAGLSIVGNASSTTSNGADIVASTNHGVFQRLSNAAGFSPLATGSIADNAITTPKIVDLAVVDVDIASNAAIGLTKLANGTLPSTITTATDNYLPRSANIVKLNNNQNADGVGVWLPYSPSLYFDVMDFDIGPNPPAFPGEIVSSSYYTVNYAKYMKLNGLVLAKVRITLNSNWGSLYGTPSFGTTLSIGLPFTPLTPDETVIGAGYFLNINAARFQPKVEVCSFSNPALAYFMAFFPDAAFFDDDYRFFISWTYGGQRYRNYVELQQGDVISMNVQYAATP
jgi:hypothetical protein